MKGPAKKIATAVGKEMSETPIRTTAAVATGSFFISQAAKNHGDVSSKVEEVKHPNPTKD